MSELIWEAEVSEWHANDEEQYQREGEVSKALDIC